MTGTSAVLPKGGVVSGFIDEDVELAIASKAPPLDVSGSAPPVAVDAESSAPAE
jgi:hypothetical protein